MNKNIGIRNPFGKTERIILGIIDGAMVPEPDLCIELTIPESQVPFFKTHAGQPFPEHYVKAAAIELDNFAQILTEHGVKVDRPQRIDFSQPITTSHWTVKNGLYAAMPRDLLITVGDSIVIAPMAWRCRYREVEAYNALLETYEALGYQILRAPKPELKDELFKP